MNRLFLIVFNITVLVFSVRSQDLRFGIDISPTLTWANTDFNKINGNGRNFGFKLRFGGEYYFRKRYAITSGLGFSFNNGGELLYDEGGNYLPNSNLSDELFNAKFEDIPQPLAPGVKIRYKIKYVEIPIGLKFRSNEFGFITYFMEVPVFTLHFRSKAIGEIIANPNSYRVGEGKTVDLGAINVKGEQIKQDIAPVALSWGAGAGLEYALGPSTAFVAGLMYQKMVTDFTKNNGYVSYYDESLGTWSREREASKAFIQGFTVKIGVLF